MTDLLNINRGGPTKLNFPSEDASHLVGQSYVDPRSENFFEFRDVCKAFDERPVLDHVSFTVKHGETCVIMGRSGVGKSVTLKRTVAIGRAFAQNPEAILYDEPTTMVDPIMARHMGDLILRLKRAFHKTSIVVTHDTHLAKRLADTVVFLQEGRVTYFGPWAG